MHSFIHPSLFATSYPRVSIRSASSSWVYSSCCQKSESLPHVFCFSTGIRSLQGWTVTKCNGITSETRTQTSLTALKFFNAYIKYHIREITIKNVRNLKGNKNWRKLIGTHLHSIYSSNWVNLTRNPIWWKLYLKVK